MPPMQLKTLDQSLTGPDSLVVRAFALGALGRGFAPRPRHTKGDKNGTGSSLVDARKKRVVPGRYKKAGGYQLFRSKSSTELMCLFQTRR